MKKQIFTFLSVLLLATGFIYAQAPEGFNYQAVIRDASGEILAGESVDMRFTIKTGSATGSTQYQETKELTTDMFGMVNHAVGTGDWVSGNFNNITWASDAKYLKVEADIGAGWVSLGEPQKLMSVPYALNARTSEDNKWNVSGSKIYYEGGSVGIGAIPAEEKLRLMTTVHNQKGLVIDREDTDSEASIKFATQDDAKWLIGMDNDESGNFNIYNYTTGSYEFTTNPDGNVGIGTDDPEHKLHVYANGEYSAFITRPASNHGPNRASIFGYRPGVSGQYNGGTGMGVNEVDAAIKGYSYWGNLYSFGVAGFTDGDYNGSGGVLGGKNDHSYWGALGYKFSGTGYGVWAVDESKSSVSTNIGIGARGDLFGAEIYGRIYGTFTEGKNYALYSKGKVYKNDLDVHLQKNDNGDNEVLYTSVSTDVSVQTVGVVTINNGKANVAFDEAFVRIVSSESPIIVTATPTGETSGVYVSNVNKNGFSITENNNGKSNVSVSYIAVGKRKGYEAPVHAPEVVSSDYTQKINEGLHNEDNSLLGGKGLYYENGELNVGAHPSTLPDPNKKPEYEPVHNK